MVKRIKTVSDLPKWFRLDKYEGAKHLDALGWLKQLDFRKKCLTFFHDSVVEKSEPMCQILEYIRNNPIYDVAHDETAIGFFLGKCPSELNKIDQNNLLGVQSMTANQLTLHFDRIEYRKHKYLKKWWEESNLISIKKIEYPTTPWINEALNFHYMHQPIHDEAVIVNMALPDSVLIEHFKKFLKTRRVERKDKSFNNPCRQLDFDDWVRFGVLPYFDLKIWEIEESVAIPNRVMADAIFLPGECGEETVRKTTKPIVDFLLTYESRIRLIAKAEMESVEKRPTVNENEGRK